MTYGVFAVGEGHRPLVARGVIAERHFLGGAIRESQREGRFLVDRCRDRAHVGIIAEYAEQMRLPILPHIAIDPQTPGMYGPPQDCKG
jgi:hypothetical protein